MEIKNINSSYNNFGTQKLFNTTVFQKASNGVKKPIKAFISELTPSDFHRADLCPETWKATKYGQDILQDFNDKYFGFNPLWQNKDGINKEIRFFTVEVPSGKGETKAIALGEARFNDSFIVLDRLQSLQGKDEAGRLTGGGSNILYIISALAKNLKKLFISLEADQEAINFYKNSGMTYEPNGDFQFFRVYQPKFADFMKNLEKRFGITPYEK